MRRLEVAGWLLVAAIGSCTAVEAAAPPLDVFATSDAVRVFEDGYACPEKPEREIRVFGLRGETISGQLAIRAAADLEKVTISVGPLRSVKGPAAIGEKDVAWNFIESIFIEKNTRKVRKSDLTRPAPARFPDCLGDERQCSIGAGTLKAVYLTIRIPADAEPGDYQGTVTVASSAAKSTLPVTLTVYPLTLPDERHLMVTEWFSTSKFKQQGVDTSDMEQVLKMLRVYAENMAEHRQNVFRVSLGLIESTLAADGELAHDFSLFDRWAQVFWDTGRMDAMETGFVAHFADGHWSSREVVLNDFTVKDLATGRSKRLPGKEFLPRFLPALVKHLAGKKWLAKTLFHIADEPSQHNVMTWREASDFVHRCAPELRRMDAIETPHCLDRLEVWVPKLNHLATWQCAFEDAQRRGNELWFYTVGIYQSGSLPNKTVDVPLVESRLLHWLNYRYQTSGYLHWGLNAWTDDPWNAPGQHNGDGWHVYPKPGGLLNSLRWEQMRAGIQDYECLWLLDETIRQVRAKLSPRVAELIQPSQRGVEIAAQVVRTYGDYERDPRVLYAARRQAIEETLDLDRSPRLIVQTTPRELSEVFNDASVDVHGWAEPGTTVKLNGNAVPVAADGLILEDVRPSREGTVTIEAERGGVKKTVVRTFRLKYPVE